MNIWETSVCVQFVGPSLFVYFFSFRGGDEIDFFLKFHRMILRKNFLCASRDLNVNVNRVFIIYLTCLSTRKFKLIAFFRFWVWTYPDFPLHACEKKSGILSIIYIMKAFCTRSYSVFWVDSYGTSIKFSYISLFLCSSSQNTTTIVGAFNTERNYLMFYKSNTWKFK